MKFRILLLSASLIITMTASPVFAARIKTLDGSVITGEVVSLQNGIYTVKTPYGLQTIPEASVQSIDRDDPTPKVAGAPLRLAGSTTIGDDLAPALLESFSAAKGAGTFTWTQETPADLLLEANGTGKTSFTAHLSRHGSGTAFSNLADGKADIGMASRRVNQQELSKLAAAGLGDFLQPGLENVLALDGIIIVVSKANPVSALTLAQIKGIFSGQVTDWSQVGGTAGPIHLIGRDKSSGTADTFNALVMGGAPIAGTLNAVDGAEGVALKVQGDPTAIGYTGFAYLGDNKALQIITECGLEFPASDLYVRTEEYPLSRRLFLYAPGTPKNENTQPFLDFALGETGQDLARKKGFIDLVPQTAPTIFGRNAVALDLVHINDDRGVSNEDVGNFLNYAKHVVNGNRVSTTFRFQFGSADLDARAVRDIDRLVAFLKSPAAANRSVLIAGFADAVGPSLSGRKLSLSRARQIAGLLQNKGITPTDVIGYGRIAPVACNSTPEGREKNRRVEVWLY